MNTESLATGLNQLLQSASSATLATQSVKHPGYPFASITQYGLDTEGCPILLLSSMATHSRNLKSDPRSSLLIASAEKSLAGARATLLGTIRPVVEDRLDEARAKYLKSNPEAAAYISFDDFSFYRMEIVDIYFVAGFGSMGWVTPDDYFSITGAVD